MSSSKIATATTRDPEIASSGSSAVLTPEELADRLVPDDPQLSPDGRAVLFTVAPVGKTGERKEQAIWIARDGETARPLTAGTTLDASPRWSPDGTRIAFRSDRAEKDVFKLYLIDPAGGEARPLGDLDGGLSDPRWSPDGQTIAVLRKDRETPEEKRRKEERDDAIVAGANRKWTRLWTIDVATGRARCLTYGERQIWSYAWSPCGDQLAIATGASPDTDAEFGPTDIAIIPVAGGVSRLVTTVPMVYTDLAFLQSADGDVLAIRANDGRNDPTPSVWVVPIDGGRARNVLPGYRGIVESLAPLPGAPSRLAVRIVEGTHGRIYALDPATGELSPLTPTTFGDGSVLAGPSLSADSTRQALIWSNATTPEEAYVGPISGDADAVSEFGTTFHGRLSPFETVHWTSSDGIEIEGLLALPAGHEPGRRYPLVVEAHGGPSWQWEDRAFLDWHDWAQLLASHGYAVLLPNPRGSTGYGSEFERLLQDDIGGGEAQDLISGAQAMVERGIADRDRLGIGGWSWGGYLSAWTITQTDIFRAAVVGAGCTNLVSDHAQGDIPSYNLLLHPGSPYTHPVSYWERSPVSFAAQVTTPTLILHGSDDERVHPGQGIEFHRALMTVGVPVEFVRYPREGHTIHERLHQIDLMRRIIAWFDRWLKPA